jgi:hypothetical protein
MTHEMTSVQSREHSPEEPRDGSPASPADEPDAILRRADTAFDLIRVGFDGPLCLSYVVWPGPLPRDAA